MSYHILSLISCIMNNQVLPGIFELLENVIDRLKLLFLSEKDRSGSSGDEGNEDRIDIQKRRNKINY